MQYPCALSGKIEATPSNKECELGFEVCRIDKVWGCAFDNGVEGLEEPVPVSVVLSIDDGVTDGEQLSQRVYTSGRKQDTCA